MGQTFPGTKPKRKYKSKKKYKSKYKKKSKPRSKPGSKPRSKPRPKTRSKTLTHFMARDRVHKRVKSRNKVKSMIKKKHRRKHYKNKFRTGKKNKYGIQHIKISINGVIVVVIKEFLTKNGKYKERIQVVLPRKIKCINLEKYGYIDILNTPIKSRRRALYRAIRYYGIISVYKKLSALTIITKRIDSKLHPIYLSDKKYVGRAMKSRK